MTGTTVASDTAPMACAKPLRVTVVLSASVLLLLILSFPLLIPCFPPAA